LYHCHIQNQNQNNFLFFLLKITQKSITFKPLVEMPQNKAQAPLITKGFATSTKNKTKGHLVAKISM